MTLNRSLFLLLAVICPAVWVGTVSGWEDAFWYMVTVLAGYWIISTLWEALRAFLSWLRGLGRVEVRIYDYERDEAYSASDIVDAEVIEESDRKWWRGG